MVIKFFLYFLWSLKTRARNEPLVEWVSVESWMSTLAAVKKSDELWSQLLMSNLNSTKVRVKSSQLIFALIRIEITGFARYAKYLTIKESRLYSLHQYIKPSLFYGPITSRVRFERWEGFEISLRRCQRGSVTMSQGRWGGSPSIKLQRVKRGDKQGWTWKCQDQGFTSSCPVRSKQNLPSKLKTQQFPFPFLSFKYKCGFLVVGGLWGKLNQSL